MNMLSIKAIQQGLAKGEFSASELAQHTLATVERLNPVINAFTDVTQDRLLREAAAIDRLRARGETLPALAGVPYAVKNLFDIKDVTTLAGAELFSGNPAATEDAFALRRLNEAGATLAGALNMDAYAYGFTTENSHYGATNNPRDIARVAGGSSGGSAAAVAAGMVNFTLGTDTNGSIRVPASLCGVLGLKPTFGRLSRSGSQPFVASLDHIGPLARSAEDLALVYDILQGKDKADNFQSDRAVEQVSSKLNEIGGLRCAVLGGFFDTWCDDAARNAVAAVACALDAKEYVTLPEAELARSAAFLLTAAEGGNHYLPALRREAERFELNSRERLLAGAMTPSAWYTQAQRFRAWFRDQTLPQFNQFDVLIAPATPCCVRSKGSRQCASTAQICPLKPAWECLPSRFHFWDYRW